MAIVNFNKWNSVPQQVDENRKAIETLAEYLEAHSATGLGIKSLTETLVSSDESGNTYRLTFVIGNQYTTPEEDAQNTYSFTFIAPKGATGATGATGETGATGAPGTNGTNGTNGLDALMSHGVCESSSGPNRMQSYFMSINLMNRTPVVGDGFVTMFENTTTQTPYLVVGEVTEVDSPTAPNTFKFTLFEAYAVRGPQGETGATGAPGAAATIEVGRTTTGEAGTQAAVTNIGTSSSAVFNFTIPRGETGATGQTGADGKDYLACVKTYSTNSTPSPSISMALRSDYFNRTPTINDVAILCWTNTTNDKTYLVNIKVTSTAAAGLYNCAVLSSIETTGAKGSQGDSGADGQGFNWMGAWANGAASEYHPYDVVSYNGSTYVCIAEAINIATPPSSDSTHWQSFVPAPSAAQVVTLTSGSSGTLTSEQLALLQSSDENYISLDNELYKLADKQTAAGYLVYSHVGKDNTQNFFVKCITITISQLAWTRTQQQVGGGGGGGKYAHYIYAYYLNDATMEYVAASFIVFADSSNEFTQQSLVNYLGQLSTPIVAPRSFMAAGSIQLASGTRGNITAVRIDTTLSYFQFRYGQNDGTVATYNASNNFNEFVDTVIAL